MNGPAGLQKLALCSCHGRALGTAHSLQKYQHYLAATIQHISAAYPISTAYKGHGHSVALAVNPKDCQQKGRLLQFHAFCSRVVCAQ